MNKRRNQGVSLVELLVAVLILGVTLPAILLTFINSMLLNETDRNNCVAVEHAQYVLEEIKSSTASAVASEINSGNWDWNTNQIESEGLTPLREEAIDTSVSGTDFLTITVSVSWDDRLGRERSTNVQTYIWVQ